MPSQIEDKIAKLIAQAEGTDHPAEAEAFMAQAEKLMLKYGIEQAQLDARAAASGQVKLDIVTAKVVIPNGHGYAMAMIEIAHVLAAPFNLRTLQSSMRDGGRVAWLIGHRSDVDQAVTLLNTLLVQSKAQAIHWWRTDGKHNTVWYTDNDAYLARREFIFAFARGAGYRLSEIHKTAVAEAGSGAELVLVDRRSQVDRWVQDNVRVGKARETSRRTGGDAARSAGFQSGREAVSPKAVR